MRPPQRMAALGQGADIFAMPAIVRKGLRGRPMAVANKTARIAWAITAKVGTNPRTTFRASGHVPHKQAGHMTWTRPLAERQNPVATRPHDPGLPIMAT